MKLNLILLVIICSCFNIILVAQKRHESLYKKQAIGINISNLFDYYYQYHKNLEILVQYEKYIDWKSKTRRHHSMFYAEANYFDLKTPVHINGLAVQVGWKTNIQRLKYFARTIYTIGFSTFSVRYIDEVYDPYLGRKFNYEFQKFNYSGFAATLVCKNTAGFMLNKHFDLRGNFDLGIANKFQLDGPQIENFIPGLGYAPSQEKSSFTPTFNMGFSIFYHFNN